MAQAPQAAAPAPAPAAPPPGGLNANRTMSAAGQAALAQREGQAPGGGYYNDTANNCTYGTGLLAHLGPCTDTELRRTVDAQQAQAELQRRVDDAAARVRQQVQDRALNQNQFDALVSTTFNTGRADNRRILGAANQGDDAGVAEHMRNTVFTHNHDANGNPVGRPVRSQGLVNRREDEVRQYGQP